MDSAVVASSAWSDGMFSNVELFVCGCSLLSILLVGAVVRRTTEATNTKNRDGVEFASALSEDGFKYSNCWRSCKSFARKFGSIIVHRASPPCAEAMKSHVANRAHALYSDMPLDLAASVLIRHACPSEIDEPVSAIIRSLCWDTFTSKFTPVKDVVCCAVTSLTNNDDAAPLEVAININAREGVMERFLKLLRARSKIRTDKYIAKRDTRAFAKQVLHILCDILVDTGNFVRDHERNGADPFVLVVPATKLGTKRDVIANVFLNDPVVGWQFVLDAACHRLGAHEAKLAFFVRRWAWDRGIAESRKGYLSPFTWTLLVLYFLRHRPPRHEEETDDGAVVVDWFAEFISFYSKRLLNTQERISVSADSYACGDAARARSSAYADGDLQSTLRSSFFVGYEHIRGASAEDDLSRTLPFIENPFDRNFDLGASMGASNVFGLWEELWRASELLEDRSSVSLAQLLSKCLPHSSGSVG
eukprot:TRINITY_DN20409_c0_g1_i2.p1 TRINITY_DN20409_c0_g1~~TRINITY_DN20409_c0_g1_i2.p1  ORF type:complete len:490 (+),score=27.52 TRINITY_DN20409_c0_g1_i2:46-1470(+)